MTHMYTRISLALIMTVCASSFVLASNAKQQSENVTSAGSASGAPISDPYGDASGRIVEAEKRLADLSKIFTPSEGFVNIVNRLNEHDPENNTGQALNEIDMSRFTRDGDGLSNVYVVADGKWEVTGTGKKHGDDAMTWTDANGKSILTHMINALRASKSGSARVSYPVLIKSPTRGKNIPEQETAVVVSSTFLMGEKNNTGKKFLAFIKVR